jgi:cell wall-associated NlpC family hydrolase
MFLGQASDLSATEKQLAAERQDAPSSLFAPVLKSTTGFQNLFSDIKQYLGIHYRFGGTTPAGFDCSGFVRYMFNKSLDIELPHSSREMATMGTRVDRSELRPGDLVFFGSSKNRINHVGIFIGDNTFIHSSRSKGITRDTLSESYYNKRFATAVRILDLPENDASPMDMELWLDTVLDDDSAS